MTNSYKSPLHQTISTTATDFWNDSCDTDELTYAIENGAVGATTNPVIVLTVLKKNMAFWRGRVREIAADHPTWSEIELSWKVIEELAVKGAGLLRPVFEREQGKKGRISVQVNPEYYMDADRMLEQALHLSQLAPNIQVKLPVTKAGLVAIEEATCRGINITATVNFTVAQSISVAEAVERGLKRRQANGDEIASMTPVCAFMVGRLDDWLQVLVKRDGIITEPGYLAWSGVAAFKKAYQIFRTRDYRARLLAAAYRHHLHWSQFIGGDVILTIPYEWQLQFNASDVEVKPRIDDPVAPEIVDELYRKFADFRRAYDEGGMSVEEFDSYGATARTLRSFISSYYELIAVVRDFVLPNPDVK